MRALSSIRRLALAAPFALAIVVMPAILPDAAGSGAAQAQPAEIGDFHVALEPYGMWQVDRRWGEVWVPFDRPPGWRPYTIGHWVYTDEWGWYWISEQDEEDWGWLTFHYGRWAHNAQLGWFWIPGDEWAPAWVNWRDSDDTIGWAPLPPDAIIDDYDDSPVYWTFIAPRYLFLPMPYRHYYSGNGGRGAFFMQRTVLVNRSLSAGGGRRFGVNPGVAPGRIAAINHKAVPTFQVRPRVLAGTQGIPNAVEVQRNQLGHAGGPQRGPRVRTGVNAVTVQKTNATIAPTTNAPPLQPLGKGERGRLGSHPPRAAAGGAATPAAPAAAPAVAPPPGGAPSSSPPAGGTRPEEHRGPPPPPAAGTRPEENRAAPPPPAPPAAGPRPEEHRVPPAPPPAAGPRPEEHRAPPPPPAAGPRPEEHRAPPPPPPPAAHVAPPPAPHVAAPPPPRPVAPPPPPPPHVAAPPPPRPAAPPAKPAAPPPKKPGEPEPPPPR